MKGGSPNDVKRDFFQDAFFCRKLFPKPKTKLTRLKSRDSTKNFFLHKSLKLSVF